MKKVIRLSFVALLLIAGTVFGQEQQINVKSFDKVIVSPHIEVNFQEGDTELVTIESANVSTDKINVEVEGKILRIYLDGAKMHTKSKKVKTKKYKGRKDLYEGRKVVATVHYKSLNKLSIRGEETANFVSPLEQPDFHLTIYGESRVYFDALTISDLTVAIYGESYLEIKEGNVANQVYRAYGESEVNTLGMRNQRTKITAYGESNFRVNVSDRLKVTSYGEAEINYEGDPDVDRGIIIGEASIRKIG